MTRRLVLVALVLALAACSSDGDAAVPASTAAVTAGSAPPSSVSPTVASVPDPTTPTTRLPAFIVRCPPVVFDGRGRTLVQADLENGDLRCADFRDATLVQVDLRGELSGADFRGAVIAQSTFDGVSALGADFTGAQIAQSTIVDSDFTGALIDDIAANELRWTRSRCPDGVPDNGLDCLGSLEPVRIGRT